MRLTLRTLLCYMDEILEPADHADIGQKIEQSEFARDLMVKTRDVTKRLRLAAPAVLGKGIGADPNSVAEYLDNTMPPERVGDFEKICLESDMHLAEVAACHQILTLVLGEPAEVDPAARERMYHVRELAVKLEQEASQAVPAPKSPEVLAAGHAAATQATGGTVAAEAVPTATKTTMDKKERAKPEVPDYLRESSRSRWKLKAFAAVLAAGIGFVALLLINPGHMFDSLLNVSYKPPEGAPEETAPPEATLDDTPETDPIVLETPSPETPAGGTAPAFNPTPGGTAPPFNPGGAATPAEGGTAPVFDPGPVPELPGKEVPPADLVVPEVPAESPPEGATPPVPTPTPKTPMTLLPKNVPSDVAPDANGLPANTEEPPLPGATAALPAKTPPAVNQNPPIPPEDPAEENPTTEPGPMATEVASLPTTKIPVTPEPAQQVGVYVSPSSVLLRLEGEMAQWSRLAPRTVLSSGDRLLALPTFRPTINLTSGMTMHLAGGTSIILRTPTADGVPVIDVLYGRLIITGSVGRGANQIQLQLGEHAHAVTFADADSTIAVHVRRVHVPGADPEAAPAPTIVDLYAVSGKIGWSDPTGKAAPVEIQAPQHRREGGILAGEPEFDPKALPEWIDSEQLSNSDRLASMTLEAALTTDRPAGLSLSELVDGRRLEVRSLASRCSVYVGQYEPFVRSLKDQDQRASWSLHIETLREAMALSPANAARIREAFERHSGQEGAALYRMLWGYSAQDLKAGADKELVAGLKSPNLDTRVLAFWNLKNITGIGLNYSPEFPENSRVRSVQRWEELLNDEKIRLPESGPMPSAALEGETKTTPE